jgi:hypothetical protein
MRGASPNLKFIIGVNKMNITERFSFEDFLAYFFPGVTALSGIYCGIKLIAPQIIIIKLSVNLFESLLFFIVSYILGVILSGISEIIVSQFKSYKESISSIDSFNKVFPKKAITDSKWTLEHYYLCRSFIYKISPEIIPIIQRQSGLRQLRINLLPIYFIFLIEGIIICTIKLVDQKLMLVGAIILLMIIFIVLLTITVERARSNERREVREVLKSLEVYSKDL